jgi:hypothetical protein
MEGEVPGMPAKCNKCGLIFETKEWGASGPFIQMSFNRMPVKCETPRCPGPAYVIEGTFQPERDGSISAISMPTASVGDFLRLRELMEKVKSSTTEKELIENIGAISPELAETITPYLRRKRGMLSTIILAILLILSKINFDTHIKTSIEIDGKINLNEIFASAVSEIEKLAGGSASATVNDAQKQSSQKLSKRQLRRIRGRTKTTRPRP